MFRRGTPAASVDDSDDKLRADPLHPQARAGAGGTPDHRRSDGDERAGAAAPAVATAERAARERTAARRTSARERAAAAAGRLGNRALGRDSRRRAPLYRNRGNALAVRPIG